VSPISRNKTHYNLELGAVTIELRCN